MTTATAITIVDAIIDAYQAAIAAHWGESSKSTARRSQFRAMLSDSLCCAPSILVDGTWQIIPNAIMVSLDGSGLMTCCYGHVAVDLLTAAIDAADPQHEIVCDETWEKVCDGTYVVRW